MGSKIGDENEKEEEECEESKVEGGEERRV